MKEEEKDSGKKKGTAKKPIADSFVFYRSWFDAITSVPLDNSKRGESIMAIVDYALYGTESDDWALIMAKPQIDANAKRRKGGENGGRPPMNFRKPTVEELRKFATENGLKDEAQKFVDYFDSVGWVVGKNKHMKDWKASYRGWCGRTFGDKKEVKKVDDAYNSSNEF